MFCFILKILTNLTVGYLCRDVAMGNLGNGPQKIYFAPPPQKKNIYLVVTSKLLLHFNWHQSNNWPKIINFIKRLK